MLACWAWGEQRKPAVACTQERVSGASLWCAGSVSGRLSATGEMGCEARGVISSGGGGTEEEYGVAVTVAAAIVAAVAVVFLFARIMWSSEVHPFCLLATE